MVIFSIRITQMVRMDFYMKRQFIIFFNFAGIVHTTSSKVN